MNRPKHKIIKLLLLFIIIMPALHMVKKIKFSAQTYLYLIKVGRRNTVNDNIRKLINLYSVI